MPTTIEQVQENPQLLVEIARKLAESEGAESVPAGLIADLKKLERPLIQDRNSVRKEFWAMLALPYRHLGVQFLDATGVLGELIPCWEGNSIRKNLRLKSFEQVHLEVWKPGLSDAVFKIISDVHDVVIDRRLNRWALTALATLLAGGDTENQIIWSKSVRRDLHEFGATEAELVWIERLVREFNAALLFLRGSSSDFNLRPEHVVACLSTLAVSESNLVSNAIKIADLALSGSISPLDAGKEG